ncbi:LytR/AlgR family response regulator transcription factor [Tahibacter amnicola]|uniref:LytTR family DNA-binding domain-containing protein n=1 Tax=Tahibacter amnicola TaxID=2976241 RepID=A0ABY6BBE1_9GAMM|nr:LytTR family DNA-binding domain-containing protein [Tahibacter amnicola]UXI66856.1 LytTR family DNA-binding domain-containing protein [Tahibacter amnicola]
MTNDSGRVRVVVADDEPIARQGLRHMLAELDWLHCVGEAANGLAAVELIDAQRPDLAFLDIQMPGLLGTDVIARCRHQPFLIFTTAYSQHAVTAFELGALDYLLKPFGPERLQAALDRARSAFGEPAPSAMGRLADAYAAGPMTRLFVRSGRAILPVPVAGVSYFEAVGDYIAAHVHGAQHIVHVSLQRLEERLDPKQFARIHRTHIVNLDHVRAFRRDADGRLCAHLHDGVVLPVSRAKAQELRHLCSG